MRAKDYVHFLHVLWERVRPDILFPTTDPSPLREGSGRESGNGTTGTKPRRQRRSKQEREQQPQSRNDGNAHGHRQDYWAAIGPLHPISSSLSMPSPFLTSPRRPVNPFAIASAAGPGHRDDVNVGTGGVRVGQKRPSGAGEEAGEGFLPPPPADPSPPPRTPRGIPMLRIPGFRPKEAQRAAWLFASSVAVKGTGVAMDEKSLVGGGAREIEGGVKCVDKVEEEAGWKERRRVRLLAGATGRKGEASRRHRRRKGDGDATGGRGAGGHQRETERKKEAEGDEGPQADGERNTESLWDFTARSFPMTPLEVFHSFVWGCEEIRSFSQATTIYWSLQGYRAQAWCETDC